MRNKFTDLVAAGVASFEHEPIAPQTPSACPICHTYNNVWGVLTDTHMSFVDNRWIITGTYVSNTTKWQTLLYAPAIGGCQFFTTGYACLSNFLYKSGLCQRMITLNGQPAIELTKCDGDVACANVQCTKYHTSESKVPHSVARLGMVQDCMHWNTLGEIAENMNRSPRVLGDQWHVSEGKIVGRALGTTIILEMNFDEGVRIVNDELTKLFEADGLGGMFYRQFPRYFSLDSSDKKWQILLRRDPNNRIFERSFDSLTPQQWYEEAKAIISNYD